jgi:hypothetical protein
MPGEIVPYQTDYETVAASQTDQILGPVGGVGNVLMRLIITATTTTSVVSIKDGNGSSIPILATGSAVGVFTVEIGARCINPTTPGWKVTTSAGVSVLAVGRFT